MTRRKNARHRHKHKQQHQQQAKEVASPRQALSEQDVYDAQTIGLVQEALQTQDLTLLRHLASSRGLVSKELRRQAWPMLLGLGPDGREPEEEVHLDAANDALAGSEAAAAGPGSDCEGPGAGPSQPSTRGQSSSLEEDEEEAVPRESGSPSRIQQQGGSGGMEGGGGDGRAEGGDRAGVAGDGGGAASCSGRGASGCGAKGGSGGRYERWHRAKHRDSHVVMVDVERSLWSFTPGMSDEQRQVLREQLRRMLDAVVGRHAGRPPEQRVHYYQGLHDVASVLLMELGGEEAAFPLLSRLVVGHLRDCTRQSLEPVLELLQLMWPLLSHADREVGQALRSVGLPPYFALSWFITWFAHDVRTLKTAARLFDLFFASHPLMPLYVGVVAVRCLRSQLLACHEMHDMHTLLAHVDPADADAMGLPLEQLLAQAARMMERLPPEALVLNLGRDVAPLCLSVSPWARLQDGQWVVPDASAVGGSGRGLSQLLSGIPQWLLGRDTGGGDVGRKRGRGSSRPLVVLSLGGMLSVCVVAVVVGSAVLRGPGSGGGSLPGGLF